MFAGALRAKNPSEMRDFKRSLRTEIAVSLGKQSNANFGALYGHGVVVFVCKPRTTPKSPEHWPLVCLRPSIPPDRKRNPKLYETRKKWPTLRHPCPHESILGSPLHKVCCGNLSRRMRKFVRAPIDSQHSFRSRLISFGDIAVANHRNQIVVGNRTQIEPPFVGVTRSIRIVNVVVDDGSRLPFESTDKFGRDDLSSIYPNEIEIGRA